MDISLDKGDPRIVKFVRHFRDYKGRRPVRIRATKTYHVADYWDGGSRTNSVFANVETGDRMSDFDAGFEQQTVANPHNLRLGKVELKPGVAVVEHRIFCGKDRGLEIVLHSDDFDKFVRG